VSAQADIYELKDGPAPAIATSLPAMPASGRAPQSRASMRKTRLIGALTWAAAALFMLGMGLWAYRAGMDLRSDVWRNSRSVRFHFDINRAFEFGNGVMRLAESLAHLPPYSDALADQSPAALSKFGPRVKARAMAAPRRLTWRELQQGLVHFYDTIQERNPNGDFDLDYPPMRLAVMTLWVRHAQRTRPFLNGFPQTAGNRVDWLMPMPEDVAQPVLNFNTACDGVAAVATFLLVWLWVARGAGGGAAPLGSVLPHGLLAFFVATAAFWYALLVLIALPPRPTPSVLVRGAFLSPKSASVVALINPEFSPTHWHVDWGPTDAYGKNTEDRFLPPQDGGRRVTMPLEPIQPGQTIHFRLSAISPTGITRSDDFVVHNQGSLIKFDSPVFGGIIWPDWTIWLRMLVLFVAMVVSARLLPLPHRAWACGLIAALLVWFDPMNLAVSHIWPQWDVWILPAFLVAALLASLNWWVAAGLILGIGCMFKGQLLLAAPMLVLWPLFAGRLGATVRILSGFLVGAGLMVWPWTITADAARWLEAVMFAALVALAASMVRLAWLREMGREWITASGARRGALIGTGIFMAAYLPVVLAFVLIFGHLPPNPDLPKLALLLLWLAAIIPPWVLPLRWGIYWLIAIFAAAIWIAPLTFHGDFSWLAVFTYGAQKHDVMAMGQGSYSNLPAMLNHRFGWQYHDIVGTLRIVLPHFQWSGALDVKTCLSIVYGACLVACAAAAAIHSRRRDPRFLLTLIVPWIIFPLVLGQMGSRYLLWACTVSTVAVGISTGLTLLHVLLTILATGMVARQMLEGDPTRWPGVFTMFTKTYPDIGWMVLLIAGIYFVCALIPTHRTELEI
jgi:hypothetical protein